jgi:hypothetical protein
MSIKFMHYTAFSPHALHHLTVVLFMHPLDTAEPYTEEIPEQAPAEDTNSALEQGKLRCIKP